MLTVNAQVHIWSRGTSSGQDGRISSNVAVKATRAPGKLSQPGPYRNIHKYIQQFYDASGPQPMFWGTDITRMPCSWQQCVRMFTEESSWLKGLRSRAGHRTRSLRLDRLEIAGVRNRLHHKGGKTRC